MYGFYNGFIRDIEHSVGEVILWFLQWFYTGHKRLSCAGFFCGVYSGSIRDIERPVRERGSFLTFQWFCESYKTLVIGVYLWF